MTCYAKAYDVRSSYPSYWVPLTVTHFMLPHQSHMTLKHVNEERVCSQLHARVFRVWVDCSKAYEVAHATALQHVC